MLQDQAYKIFPPLSSSPIIAQKKKGDILGTALKQAIICLKLHTKKKLVLISLLKYFLLLDVNKWPEQDGSEEQ